MDSPKGGYSENSLRAEGVRFLSRYVVLHRERGDGAEEVSHLYLNVANFGSGADDRPAHQRWEDVLGEVGPCISALHKLREESEWKGEDRSKETR